MLSEPELAAALKRDAKACNRRLREVTAGDPAWGSDGDARKGRIPGDYVPYDEQLAMVPDSFTSAALGSKMGKTSSQIQNTIHRLIKMGKVEVICHRKPKVYRKVNP
jgi:hypothetical protein